MNRTAQIMVLAGIFLCLAGGLVFLWVRGNSDDSPSADTDEEQSDTDENADSDGDEVADDDESADDSDADDADAADDTDEEVIDLTNFSDDTQTVGDSTDKDDAEYTLTSITDEQRAAAPSTGYHRFVFSLSSSETELPEITAQLISSGNYIKVSLDRVTDDETGIGYQQSRTINVEGITKLYRDVTPAGSTSEIYRVGIADDTTFYLHEGTGLQVILDVAYPGGTEEEVVEDPTELGTAPVELSDTNTTGDARIVRYAWSVEGGVLKFAWETASTSGNPTPPTSAEYDAVAKTITVTFEELKSDGVTGTDDIFGSSLSAPVTSADGTKSGTTSTYVFSLSKETTYRIYRDTSPNQVILEIAR